MRLVLALVTLVLYALPALAPAATVGGKTRSREGTDFGTMKFRAGKGVANHVVVKPVEPFSTFRITERSERLRARGECRQDGRHSAICPWTESDEALIVIAGGKGDRVNARGKVDVLVRGGNGNDVLLGNGDELFGDRGDDILRGGNGWDRLHGGSGRDRVDGRGGSRFLADVFYDDETDRQASRDVYIARPNNRAELDYSKRNRDLRIDLHESRIAPEGDRIEGVKGLIGGSGDDVFIGTGGRNRLQGGGGNDRLFGRLGPDHLSGGKGDDRMFGEDGADWLTEGPYWDSTANGHDRFVGGKGQDELVSLDGLEREDFQADDVRCDSRDQAVESDPKDRLRGCRRVKGWDIALLDMRVKPDLTAEGARFTFRCDSTESEQVSSSEIIFRCHGRIAVRSRSGEDYGSQEFSFETDSGGNDEHSVTVPLTAGGRRAIRRGEVVTVDAQPLSTSGYNIPPAGYRAPIG
jgi:hypothetical protein